MKEVRGCETLESIVHGEKGEDENVATKTVAMTEVMSVEGERRLGVDVVRAVASCLASHSDGEMSTYAHLLSPQRIYVEGWKGRRRKGEEERGEKVYITGEDVTSETRGGVVRYLAPEVREVEEVCEMGEGEREKACVFSLALILVECLTIEAPFRSDVDEVAHQRICDGEIPPLDSLSSRNSIAVLRRLLAKDPRKRPSLRQLPPLLDALLSNEETDVSSSDWDFATHSSL